MQSKEKPVLTKKTFKRELAVVLLIWLVYVVETKDVEIVEVLVWPVFSFAAASFGFDAYGKLQSNTSVSHGRGSKRSGQRTGGQDKLPDDWHDK